MPLILGHLLVAAAVTVAVGLLTGGGWTFLIGSALALSLWVMLFAGSYAVPPGEQRGRTTTRQYAVAAAVAVVLGYVVYRIGGDPAFWAVGFIMAGALVPAGAAAVRDSQAGSA
ncbi:hypothetical protein EUA93_19555 [Nocardioides oleivorans]|uniref:DUF2568 domain-containing protein n=1 Tax=Nocardioides oleivorans TaxID=273676 RepID=A0A4Q2RQ84_9ACTN|nr:hypothetical protein [Nocardioides oleivorans]RYB91120.1 hypothetical protein EUA93_19555 [Nocardioides oleivorans]